MSTIPTAADIVTTEARKWLELADDLMPVVPLAAAVANFLDGEPVWLAVIAPPSSGKSDILMAMSSIKGVHMLSTITPKTFASGLKPTPGKSRAPSLLERLQAGNKRLLIFKDFGTILNLHPNDRNTIFAQLREIYDGRYSASFGTGIDIDWKGRIGVLAGATPNIDHAHRMNAELGERFVSYRPLVPDPGRVAMKALLVSGQEDERRAALQQAYRSAFGRATAAWQSLKRQGQLDVAPEAHPAIAALGEFVAAARRAVRHERSRWDDTFEVLPPEGPARLLKVLNQLHRAAVICYGGNTEAAMRLTVRVGVDSLPGKRGVALRELARNQDGITANSLAGRLQCDAGTAARELKDLVAIGLVTKSVPVKTTLYEPSPLLLDFAARIYLDELPNEDALSKLFDLSSNYAPEREKEKKRVGAG